MADSVALMRAASNTGKLADSFKGMWEERTKLRADNTNQAWDLVLRAQIDEVYLVLAHLGEAILPLGVFNKDYYLQTLGDVKASLSSCGNQTLLLAWEELDAELQYCCTAGFTFCAHFSPMPVYRGFGACVLSDWDWGCPDMTYLEEKARKKAIRTLYGIKQKTDPQPTRSIFQDFDQVIQILQVKPMAFFVKRPPPSGFTEQPRFGARPKKEVKSELDLLEDWLHQITRRGHPVPPGQQITNWGIPYATWTSESNYYILKSEKDCETLMCNQMDPGRLLHAFVCRKAATLDEHSIFLLMPRTAAESLLSWLEGLPGMNHKIIKWQDLDTENFEKKISKSLRKKIGQYPLPIRYAVKHPQTASRPELHVSESSPAILEHPNTVSPPPYSPTNAPGVLPDAISPPQRERASTVPLAELSGPETQELPAEPAFSPTQPPEQALQERASKTGLKSFHTLRQKPSSVGQNTVATAASLATATKRHPSLLRPGAVGARNSANWMIEEGKDTKNEAAELPTEEKPGVTVAELPAEMAAPDVPARKPVPSVAVDPPVECAELPVPPACEKKVEESTAAARKPSVSPPQLTTAPPAVAPAPAPPSKDDLVPASLTPGRKSSADSTPKVENPPAPSPSAPSPPAPAPAPAVNNDYLELLNKIARGEISPQALGEMLQSGSVGAQEVTSGDAGAKKEKGKVDLPYPESPREEKAS